MTNQVKMNHLKIYFMSLCNAYNNSSSANRIRFTENKNQWDANLCYRTNLDVGALFVEKNCFAYHFYDKETELSNQAGKATRDGYMKGHVFRMTFLHALEHNHSTEKTCFALLQLFYQKRSGEMGGWCKKLQESALCA